MTAAPPNCFKQLQQRGYENVAFICWPSQIQQAGHKLVRALQESLEDLLKDYGGGRVFLDVKRMQPGYKWDMAIRGSLCRSAVAVVILVDSFFDSVYCATEWHIVEQLQDRRLPRGQLALTCFQHIVLREGVRLPEEIQQIHCETVQFRKILSFSGNPRRHKGWKPAVDALIERIKFIVEQMCLVSENDQRWGDEEEVARTLGPKTFTWGEAPAAPTERSRVERNLPILDVSGGRS